jgi:hypothetical protein
MRIALTAAVAGAALLLAAGVSLGKIGSRTEISADVVSACDTSSDAQCLAKVDEILRYCPENDVTEGSECVCTDEHQRAAQGLADAVTIVSESNPTLRHSARRCRGGWWKTEPSASVTSMRR